MDEDRPRRIVVLAPMRTELAPVVKRLRLKRDGQNDTRWESTRDGVRVIAACAGVGTAPARAVTETMIDELDPDHVVVVGIAGALGAELAIGDLVTPAYAIDAASGDRFDATGFGLEVLAGEAPTGGVITTDHFLDPSVTDRHHRSGVLAVDMETSAVAAVCVRRDVTWSAYRAISDRLVDGLVDERVAGLIGADGRPNVVNLLRYLGPRPWRILRLARLGRDSNIATRAAAEALAASLGW